MLILKGTIKEVLSTEDYSATISLGDIGECKARATRFENEPHENDDVIVIVDEYFSLGFYIPLKVIHEGEFTGIARSGYKLEFTEEGEIIVTSKDEKVKIDIKDDTITIENEKSSKVEMSGTDITVSAQNVKITGGNLEVNGSCSPTSSGAFCGIAVCPFTGAPHIGNKITGT